jgi:hypothetical protein
MSVEGESSGLLKLLSFLQDHGARHDEGIASDCDKILSSLKPKLHKFLMKYIPLESTKPPDLECARLVSNG